MAGDMTLALRRSKCSGAGVGGLAARVGARLASANSRANVTHVCGQTVTYGSGRSRPSLPENRAGWPVRGQDFLPPTRFVTHLSGSDEGISGGDGVRQIIVSGCSETFETVVGNAQKFRV
jgi:hypothetical protein